MRVDMVVENSVLDVYFYKQDKLVKSEFYGLVNVEFIEKLKSNFEAQGYNVKLIDINNNIVE